MKRLKMAACVMWILMCCMFVSMPAQAAKVKLNYKTLSIKAGKQKKLKLKGAKGKVTWKTSNKKVAVVNKKGMVTAKKKGKATITAKYKKKKYKCKVKVISSGKKTKSSGAAVSYISLSDYSVSINTGEKITIKAYVYPSNAASKTVKWSSSNTKVAKVDSAGRVTGVSKGSAVVTASCGGKKAACTVSVSMGFSEKDALGNLTHSRYQCAASIVDIVKNNNNYAIYLSAECIYYDSAGRILDTTSDYCFALESGRECVLIFNIPYGDGSYINYASYKINYSAHECDDYLNASKISWQGDSINVNDNLVLAEVTNNGERVDSTRIDIIFYKDGQVVGGEYAYAEVDEPGVSDIVRFRFPKDANGDYIIPDRYRIYVHRSSRY